MFLSDAQTMPQVGKEAQGFNLANAVRAMKGRG